MSIHSAFTRIQQSKIKSFNEKVRAMTRSTLPANLDKIIDDLNSLLRVFANYYRIADCSVILQKLLSWISRRLRAIQLKQWKNLKRLHRRLRQLGYVVEFKTIRMNYWANAASLLSHYALPNDYLHKERWLFDLSSVTTGISVSK